MPLEVLLRSSRFSTSWTWAAEIRWTRRWCAGCRWTLRGPAFLIPYLRNWYKYERCGQTITDNLNDSFPQRPTHATYNVITLSLPPPHAGETLALVYLFQLSQFIFGTNVELSGKKGKEKREGDLGPPTIENCIVSILFWGQGRGGGASRCESSKLFVYFF